MRVISGSARGRMLDAVPGKNTRPTTDKVKESVFNILQFRLYDAAMLDLFAGTGQMGIEALRRGAAGGGSSMRHRNTSQSGKPGEWDR